MPAPLWVSYFPLCMHDLSVYMDTFSNCINIPLIGVVSQFAGALVILSGFVNIRKPSARVVFRVIVGSNIISPFFCCVL